MKQLPTQTMQMHLLLLEPSPLELPSDKQRELTLALAELLLAAAGEIVRQPVAGGADESETQR